MFRFSLFSVRCYSIGDVLNACVFFFWSPGILNVGGRGH